MKLLTDWGLSLSSWQGQRGEYWVVAQAFFLLGFVILPVYRPAAWVMPSPPHIYWIWLGAALLGAIALVFLGKGLLDLGHSLTPLPYPRNDASLVQTGIYSLVRHPIYSGVTFATLSWALYQLSLSHLVGAIALFLFLNAKASREEKWLSERYPEYGDYQTQVKKMIPWMY